jgi:hypothetical protein
MSTLLPIRIVETQKFKAHAFFTFSGVDSLQPIKYGETARFEPKFSSEKLHAKIFHVYFIAFFLQLRVFTYSSDQLHVLLATELEVCRCRCAFRCA